MRVMVMIKAPADGTASSMSSWKLQQEMDQFNTDLVRAGVLVAGQGLAPASRGARLRCHGSQREVVRGAISGSGTHVTGFWLWQVDSMDEAIAWARCCPGMPTQTWEIEIQPLVDSQPLGAGISLGLRERDQHMRQGLQPRG